MSFVAVVPPVVNVVGLSIMWWYPLAEERHAAIRAGVAGHARREPGPGVARVVAGTSSACALFHGLRVPAAIRLTGRQRARALVGRHTVTIE